MTKSLFGDVSGYIGGEMRVFPSSSKDDKQPDLIGASLAFEPKLYFTWKNGDQVSFVPNLFIDRYDAERTAVDIRELFWLKAASSWELGAGINKVFWGVTESNHLVDIINQTDLARNPDGEEKLGQPMIMFSKLFDIGTLEFFFLPYFRERTFAHERLGTHTTIHTDDAEYESSARQWHPDWAVRWSQTVNLFDIGISHFYGTSREPRFLDFGEAGHSGLMVPYYELIHQTGIDVQWTREGWLIKLEAINRFAQESRFIACVGGFEYTFAGIFDSAVDLGVLAEYMCDERRDDATTPYENDLFLGTRFVFNNIGGTEILAGTIFDLKSHATIFSGEAQHRIGDHWKLNFDVRLYDNIPPEDPLYPWRRDDFVQMRLARYF